MSEELTKAVVARRQQTLASLILAELERMIVACELSGGDRINESALALKFQVSRGPIREACRGLEKTGLVHVVTNRGVFVREISRDEAMHIYDVRAQLFGLAARLAAERRDAGAVQRLQQLVAALDEATTIDAFYPINVELHLAIVAASGNPRVAAIYEQLGKELHLFRRRGLVQPESMRQSNKEHRQIVAAIAKSDGERAEQLARAHVLAGKHRLVASMKKETR